MNQVSVLLFKTTYTLFLQSLWRKAHPTCSLHDQTLSDFQNKNETDCQYKQIGMLLYMICRKQHTLTKYFSCLKLLKIICWYLHVHYLNISPNKSMYECFLHITILQQIKYWWKLYLPRVVVICFWFVTFIPMRLVPVPEETAILEMKWTLFWTPTADDFSSC
jgi:hypothetical protein